MICLSKSDARADHYDVFQNFDVKEWRGYTNFLKFTCNNYAVHCTDTDGLDLMESQSLCVLDLRNGFYRTIANKCIFLRSNCKELGCKYDGIFLVKFNLIVKKDERTHSYEPTFTMRIPLTTLNNILMLSRSLVN